MGKAFVNTLDSTQKKNLDTIISTLKADGYTNPLTIAAICAIVSKESVFKLIRENMNYSTARIGEVWPRLKGRSDLGGNPEGLANEVYGGKYGNGPKDGYKYRGGGFNQLTFKSNYKDKGSQTGTDLGTNPDSIATASTAAKVLSFYYKDNFALMKKKGKLQKYGSEDLNGFTDLKNAICAAYHATAGAGKSTDEVLGLLKSDSLGGMTKAQANGPDLLNYVKAFSGLETPPETTPSSDGGSTNTTAETPAVVTPKAPPDPQTTIANIKLVKKSGPGEIMGATEISAYLGEGSVEGLQFDEPGEYVIQAISDDPRIVPVEFTVTVTGDPNPKSTEKPQETAIEGSRPIIAQLDPPGVDLPPIRVPAADSDAQSNLEIMTTIGLNPFIWFNGYQITEKNLKTLSLYHEGMTPCIQFSFNDEAGILKKDGFPLDDTTFEFFLSSGSPNIKSIHMRFKLADFVQNKDKTYSATGTIDLRDYYKIKFNSYKGTSFDVLRKISKELQLGFNSNIDNTNDEMKWTNVGKTWREFMNSILEHSYIDDKSFMMGYIDFYYCFNYVDVEKEWLRDNSSDVGISLGSNDRLAGGAKEEKITRLVLTNEKSMNGSDLFFINPNLKNNSTSKSITKGQKTVTKFYDVKSKAFLIFDIESQTSPDNDKIILKGKPGDDKDLKENFRTRFGGKIDLDNVHKNYAYAKDQNERNLNELNKLSISLELPSANFNLYKFQKIRLQFINEAPTPADQSLTQERINGDWIILEIKYIWVRNKMTQNLVCIRKEVEKTAEEKQNETTDKKPESKSGNDNPLVQEVPPNSIYKVDEEYTVKDKDGRLYTVTVQKLLENGNEIEGFVLENIEQPNLTQTPSITNQGSTQSTTSNTPVSGSQSTDGTPTTTPSKVWKIYVDMGGVLFEKMGADEGGSGNDTKYIGSELWEAIKKYVPKILSATSKSDKKAKEEEKRKQVKDYLSPQPEIYFVESGIDKKTYAADDAILIDDTKENVDAFIGAKGKGILHDNKNIKKTIEELEKILKG